MPNLKQFQILNSLLKKVSTPTEAAGKTQLWHSSPHRFDRFDLSKIGSGEGNQSFGHGIYLAESPAVSGAGGQYFEKFKKHPAAKESGGPHTYKVEVPDTAIEKMLDWDKTLDTQNPFVADRLSYLKDELVNARVLDDYLEQKNADWNELTGGELFRQIMGRAHMDDALPELTDLNPYKPNQASSKFLQNMGIPGVKYLDQLSREAKDGTRNFVTFSDELPRIIERNGQPLDYADGGEIRAFSGGGAKGRIIQGIQGGLGALKDMMDPPKNTVKAYKLFRTNPEGDLHALYVNADRKFPIGQWVPAEIGQSAGNGKVKSSIGNLAFRPGLHAGSAPTATHIGGALGPRIDPKTGEYFMTKSGQIKKVPTERRPDEVWAEIDMPDDFDWQTIANERGMNSKGILIPKNAHITDQIPTGGHYRYKTNPNMEGEWLIGGGMKINKILTDEEVEAANRAAGVIDLPRTQPSVFPYDRFDFDQPISESSEGLDELLKYHGLK